MVIMKYFIIAFEPLVSRVTGKMKVLVPRASMCLGFSLELLQNSVFSWELQGGTNMDHF